MNCSYVTSSIGISINPSTCTHEKGMDSEGFKGVCGSGCGTGHLGEKLNIEEMDLRGEK